MKIYTKKGDKGTTGLIGGTRVLKSSMRIEAYGTIDELNSYIGVVRDHDILETYKDQLIEIQDRLFTIGSSLASDPDKSTMKIPDLKDTDIQLLENWMDEMDAALPEMKNFILPGGHPAQHEFVAELVIIYINRLSDYLFVLGRKIGQDLGAAEQPWRPRL